MGLRSYLTAIPSENWFQPAIGSPALFISNSFSFTEGRFSRNSPWGSFLATVCLDEDVECCRFPATRLGPSAILPRWCKFCVGRRFEKIHGAPFSGTVRRFRWSGGSWLSLGMLNFIQLEEEFEGMLIGRPTELRPPVRQDP